MQSVVSSRCIPKQSNLVLLSPFFAPPGSAGEMPAAMGQYLQVGLGVCCTPDCAHLPLLVQAWAQKMVVVFADMPPGYWSMVPWDVVCIRYLYKYAQRCPPRVRYWHLERDRLSTNNARMRGAVGKYIVLVRTCTRYWHAGQPFVGTRGQAIGGSCADAVRRGSRMYK
jgi:hypothetical protein